MAETNPHQERLRLIFVLGATTISMGILLLDSFFFKGILSAEVWGYGFTAVFLAYALLAKDRLVLLITIFGIIAGLAELVADHYLVAWTDTLIYPKDEPMLWSSPAYMPFSWAVVLVELGFIGWLLTKKFNLVVSGLILAVAGALLVPLYEHWAIVAGWWSYTNTVMVGPVPVYVIIAEGLLMLPVPWMISRLESGNWISALVMGILEGLVMLLACIIAVESLKLF